MNDVSTAFAGNQSQDILIPKLHPKLFVVDDSAIDLQKIMNTLQDYFELAFATSIKEAATILKKRSKPDLILLDIMLPDGSGLEFYEYLQANPATKDIPVVFISALDTSKDKLTGLGAGAIDYIIKPFSPKELKARLLTYAQLLLQIKQLEKQAYTDSLTGAYNRRRFDQVLEDECYRCQRNKDQISLIMIDLDNFKSYNDYHGHAGGDKALIKFAKYLGLGASRRHDFFARFGGDEFVLLLPNCNKKSAQQKITEIKEAISQLQLSFEKDGKEEFLTASFGIGTLSPNQDMTPEALFDLADKALFRAKKAGRNCWA